ncbi:MAG: hypothetical protein V1495_06935, partial [Pseudomonadota bacterium]
MAVGRAPFLLLLAVLAAGCKNTQVNWVGIFSGDPSSGFRCYTGGLGWLACSDTDGDGEPDRTDGGHPFTPKPSEGSDDAAPAPPAGAIPDTGEDLDGPLRGFDLDVFDSSRGSTWETRQASHTHLFDNQNSHYNVVDFFSDTNFGFAPAVEGCTDLTFRVRHADRGSGALDLTFNGVPKKFRAPNRFSDTFGYANGDFILHESGPVTVFRWQPNRIGVLAGTQPSVVQKDTADRHGSFTVQVFCGSTRVWEFAAYEHVAEGA